MFSRPVIFLLGFLLFCHQQIYAEDMLKIRQPHWRTRILTSFSEGGAQRVLFYEPSIEQNGDVPVKEIEFFKTGEVHTEKDLTILPQDHPLVNAFGTTVVPHGVCIRFWPNGAIAKMSAYDHGLLHGHVFCYDENGILIEKKAYRQGKLTGRFERFFPNQTKAFSAHYKDGVLEGELIEWHPNGAIKSIQNYSRGLLNSTPQKPAMRLYNENRTLIETRDFRFGCPYGVINGRAGYLIPSVEAKKDKEQVIQNEVIAEANQEDNQVLEEGLDGEKKEYYPDEQLKSSLHYKDGKFHGVQEIYYPNGQLHTLVTYQNGILNGRKAYWNLQGDLLEEAFYEDGDLEGRYYQRKNDGTEHIANYRKQRLDGELAVYNKDGAKIASSFYKEGKREGVSTIYSSKGLPVMTIEYRQGKKHGLACEYFVNGKIKYQVAFADDLEEGEEKVYFKNGHFSAIRSFHQGKLDGTAREWNKEGMLIFEADYREGRRHGNFLKYDQAHKRWIKQRYENDALVQDKESA